MVVHKCYLSEEVAKFEVENHAPPVQLHPPSLQFKMAVIGCRIARIGHSLSAVQHHILAAMFVGVRLCSCR